jgi:L-glutamine-phosphate cytidylyltransferase
VTVQVVILAAGRGSRLGALTGDRPKCLVELAGRPLIEWQLRALAAAGLRDIGLVTGYCSERLAYLGLPTWHNRRWAETNMVASLLCAEDALHGQADLLVAYSDIVYEPRVVAAVLAAAGDVVTAIDRDWLALWRKRSDDPLGDAESLLLDERDRILEIGRRPSSLDVIEGQYIGLTRLTPAGKRKLLDLMARGRSGAWTPPRPLESLHFTDALAGLIEAGEPVQAAPIRRGWLEVDTPQDLATYEALWQCGDLDRFLALPA